MLLVLQHHLLDETPCSGVGQALTGATSSTPKRQALHRLTSQGHRAIWGGFDGRGFAYACADECVHLPFRGSR